MKKIGFVIATLCGYLNLSAQEQEYIPFVRDCEFGYYEYFMGWIQDFSHYCIQGDAEFEGKKYKGFYYYTDKENTELIGYVREEDRKVYLRQNDKDWLWYDFTLQVGDVITVDEESPFSDWSLVTDNRVRNVEILEFVGMPRTHISFDNTNNYWVEGIGDIQALPLSIIDEAPTCICGNQLFYVKENGQFIYRQESHWGGQVPINDPFLDESGIDEMAVTPLHIVQYPGQWVVAFPDGAYRLAEVIDATGRVAWCDYLDGESGSITIPTTDMARGIYIVALTAQSGERITCKVVH